MASEKQISSLETLLHRMMNRIRQSLELPEILSGTVAEVRAFLQTDRVMVYQFHQEGCGEVVAESVNLKHLPSLFGQHFPAEDIPPEARELFLKARQRSIVNVAVQSIGLSSLDCPETGESLDTNDIRFRPVDPCHIEYLTSMGVQSSLVVPILYRNQLWGLLVSHHAQPRQVTARELQVVQLVADQVSIAIAQSTLLEQTRAQAAAEATINRVAKLLHSMTQMQLQEALEQTVSALQGVGGRVYITPQHPNQTAQVYTCGTQPVGNGEWGIGHEASGSQRRALVSKVEATGVNGQGPSGMGQGASGNDKKINAQSPIPNPQSPMPNSQCPIPNAQCPMPYSQLEEWLETQQTVDEGIQTWAIADLSRVEFPSDLREAFLNNRIRSLLVVRLQYRQHVLGYLSVFRHEIEIEKLWARRPDRDDPRHEKPKASFEKWRELKQGQAKEWSVIEIELVKRLASHFAMAIHQYKLYQEVKALNSNLQKDIQERKQAERKISALNAQLEQRVQERTAELQRANVELKREMSERERNERDRKQARASLERLSRQHELILNSAGEGIYGLNSQGKITFINPAAARMLGYKVKEICNQYMHAILNHSQPDGTLYTLQDNPIYTTLQHGTVQYITDDIFCRQDGTKFPVEYVSTPIREQGEIVGAVVIFKDITERQIVERMKDEFISVVSHELRTPLTSIRSALGLLASGSLKEQPSKSQRMLEIAFDNTNRLVRLINDILDIERINSGKVTMRKQKCNAADLIQQAVDEMRAMAEKAEITLCSIPTSVEIWADPDRIIQTLTNLLSNAIKFSPPGTTVWLIAETRENREAIQENREILFQVKDQGKGIPNDKKETIFDRFQQVDASNSRSQSGTGLGLAICRSIVQQHGGKIWVESILGKGSNFYFSLPITQKNKK